MEKSEVLLGLESRRTPDRFTPVRRKESTLNDGRLSRDIEKAWTAARCNRLLRPLTSRITILQKKKQSSFDCINKTQSKKGKSVSPSKIDALNEKTPNNNANWVGRKRVKRTYSGKIGNKGSGQHISNTESSIRVSSNDKRSSNSEEFMIPTPLLNRAWRKTNSPYRAIPDRGAVFEHCQQIITDSDYNEPTKGRFFGDKAPTLGQAMRGIQNTLSSTRFNIYEGIYNGLDALLRATHPTTPKGPERGPKSLLSLCLATVPSYITMEEKLLSSEIERVGSHSAIEKRDISTEIYDDLELLGSSGRGWVHLQSVVRAHGVQLICDAILEGLLEYNFCERLVDLCIHSDSHDEAALMLSILLSVKKFPSPPSFQNRADAVLPWPLSNIREFVEKTNRTTGYEYRQLSILIQNGNLPLPWVATPAFAPIWTSLMQDLSVDHARVDAAMLMNTVLPLLVKYVSLSDSISDTDFYEGCTSTLLSLLTTISSIIILSRDDDVGDNLKQDSKHTTAVSNTHSRLLKDCLAAIKRDAKETDLRSTVLLLACLVTETDANMSDFIVNSLYEMDAEYDGNYDAEVPSQFLEWPLYNEAARFLSSVARCCGKGASTSGFEYLQHIHRRLQYVNTGKVLKARTIWHGIIVDSAFAFAQVTPGQKYLDYAESLDAELHATNLKRSDLVRKQTCHESRAFRWEEGISSWVTATPAPNVSKAKIIPPEFESDDLDFESPSIFRSQRPVQLSRGTKREYNSDEYDQSPAPGLQLSSRLERETRRGKTAFDIWHHDSSDDELNSSYESFENTRVLKDLRNTATRRRSKFHETKRQKHSPTINCKQLSFSEDELGI